MEESDMDNVPESGTQGGRGFMTERTYLSGRGGKKLLDMEKIYKQIDSGRGIDEVAKEWGVSRTTLYRRHREYQTEVAALKHKSDIDLDLPPLPQ